MSIIGIIVIAVLIVCLMPVFVAIFYAALIALALYCIYLIYQAIYFRSEKFLGIKNEIKTYADECNELNLHIEELKSAYLDIKHLDYGNATYTDNSIYNFKRPELKKSNKNIIFTNVR